ncbi:MAG: hypothetical protein H6567_09555 [Lewinellaceae bacterium]|nr:hypothetical protein [Lewinellaceae bacterium]
MQDCRIAGLQDCRIAGLTKLVVFSLFFSVFLTQCQQETTSSDDKTEVRGACDGAQMGAPKFTPIIPSPPGLCCFNLEFSFNYPSDTGFQIIGFDPAGNSMATKPNGYCTGTLLGNTLQCCLDDTAVSMSVTLFFPGGGSACVEMPVSCGS